MPVLTPGSPATDVAARVQQRARIAVAVTFAVNGMLLGSWAPRIPAVKDALGLSAGALGIALLAPALGTILMARVAGALVARHGSGRITCAFAMIYCALSWMPGAVSGFGLLWLALLVWGAAMGSLDVSMNAQGVSVQGRYGRPILASFHAVWSIGSFAGALLGGLGAALDVPVWLQQAVLGALLAVPALIASRHFVSDPPHEAAVRAPLPRQRLPQRLRPHRWGHPQAHWRADPHRIRLPRVPGKRLVLLGFAAIFALMAEGAVTDWSGVLLRDHLHVSSGQASFGYAAFCVTMTAGRLVGDRLVHALGRARCLAGLAMLGAVGLAAGLATDRPVGAIAGFALLGIGLSVMVPVLFSTAADTDGPAGPAIAAVSALGCVGLLAGPSLIGLVAELTSVQAALFLLPPFTVLAGALGVLGVRLSRLRQPPT